jgi:hypothetical protein
MHGWGLMRVPVTPPKTANNLKILANSQEITIIIPLLDTGDFDVELDFAKLSEGRMRSVWLRAIDAPGALLRSEPIASREHRIEARIARKNLDYQPN